MAVELFECEPKGENLIIVGGPNGAGKTTALNAIWYVLGGKPNLPDPLPNGTKKIHDRVGEWVNWDTTECRAEIVTEDIRMERRWWPDPKSPGEVLSEVRAWDARSGDFGKPQRYKREQELLDSLLNQIGFDFTLFLRKNDIDQGKELKALFPELDNAALEREEAELIEARKDAKREVERIQGRNAGMVLDKELKKDEDSVAELTAELTKANLHNQEGTKIEQAIKTAEEGLEASPNWVASKERQIAAIKQQLKEAEEELSNHLIKKSKAQKDLGLLCTALLNFKKRDTEELAGRIEKIGETNATIRENNRIREALAEFRKADDVRAKLEQDVLNCRKKQKDLVAQALKTAKFAVDGVEIRDGIIWFQDVPLKQQNTEKQFRFCAAVAIKRNPLMPVFRLGDGEKVTPPNMELLRKIAVESNAQVFCEFAMTEEMLELAKENPDICTIPTLFVRDGRSSVV